MSQTGKLFTIRLRSTFTYGLNLSFFFYFSGSNSKSQDSPMLSLSGEIPLGLQHSPKFNIGSFSDNSTENDVQLNAISSYPITEISQTVPYQSNFKSDNVSKNFPYPTDPTSSTQFQKTASSMPVYNSLSATLCKTESSFETDISTRSEY